MSPCKLNIFKVIFAIGNILILGLGVVFIVTASYDCQIYSDIDQIANVKQLSFLYKHGLTPLMIIGGILIIVAFIGVCGIICRSTIALILYSILMLGLAALLGYACGSTLAQTRETVSETITKDLTETFQTDRLKTMTESFDKLEEDYKCCGVNGPKDYTKAKMGDKVPMSCCEDKNLTLCPAEKSYKDGCALKLTDYTVKRLKLSGWVGIIAAVIMVCFAVAGFWYGIRAICCL